MARLHTTIERFIPKLDALPGAASPPPPGWRRVELRSILMRGQEEALSLLEQDFGFAVHLCPVQKACEEIILRGELESLLETSGAVFASLDYLFARAAPPRLDEGAKLQWSFFPRRRSLDFFMANGAQLLAFLGVLRAVPEQWLPEELLSLDLHRRFEDLQFVEKVAFEASLLPRIPGGIQWLKRKSLENFAALERECLRAPAPFVLLLRRFDSIQTNIFVANSCSHKSEDELLLRYCDATGSSQQMEVALSLPDWGREFVTIGGERQQVLGLLRVRYASQPPPLDKLQQLLGVIGIRGLFWRLRRRLYRTTSRNTNQPQVFRHAHQEVFSQMSAE